MHENKSRNFLLCHLFCCLLGAIAAAIYSYQLNLPLSEQVKVSWGFIILVSFIELTTVALIFSQIGRCLSRTCLLFILMFIAVIVHFPGALQFHWDEWDIFWRYTDSGFAAAMQNHGEHVIPVFLSYYFLEAELFNFSYPSMLLISSLIIGLNGYLVFRWFESLGLEKSFDRPILILASLLYTISSLQTETAEWAFIQCVSVQNALTLFAAIRANTWACNRNSRDLAISLLALLAAPLFQATGWISPVFVIISLTLLSCFKTEVLAVWNSLKKLILIYGLTSVAAMLPVLFVYLALAQGNESAQPHKFSNPDIWSMLKFFLSGTLGVTLARGSGLFPSLSFESNTQNFIWEKLPLTLREFLTLANYIPVAVGVIVAGLAFAILAYDSNAKRRRENILLYFAALLIIGIFFVLPTLGRYEAGLVVSTHQRYQTRELVGFALLLVAVLNRFFTEKSLKIQLVGWAALATHLLFQNRMQDGFSHFTNWSIRTEQAICLAQQNQDINLREEISKTISPHWAFSEQVFLRVIKRLELECNYD